MKGNAELDAQMPNSLLSHIIDLSQATSSDRLFEKMPSIRG
jgi:hypothetical protein